MLVYRIASETYIRDVSGEGARLFGGRWNRKGIRVIYTSQSKSLAALEVLANTPLVSIPEDLCCLVLNVPDGSITEIKKKDLPVNWYGYPSPDVLKQMGTNWIESSQSLVCKVPSALINSESNFLINPAHPKMDEVKIEEVHAFRFDKRIARQ